ncbi:MAG: hypothetical protein IPJ11_02390 [Gemmatimonadetes bacterium]|nr:hypothetical protein [Gemmatimonadota bacterium]
MAGAARTCVDPGPERLDITNEVKTDVGQLRDRLARLLDDLGHVAVGVGHHHAKALVVLDLLGPDDPVGIEGLRQREVGLEDGVDEDDHHRPVDERPREVDRSGGAILDLLLDEARGDGVAAPRVRLDLVLEVPRDEDELLDVEAGELVHHPVHHRTAGDLQHRLRDQVRVRPEPGALPCGRNDHLHQVSLVRSGR